MDRRVFLAHVRRTRFAAGDRAAARADAQRIAVFLVREGATRVAGIGSAFVPGRRFTSRSDIDLAVEGLPPDRFIGVSARAAEMTALAVDIIPIESATGRMRRVIREEGVELWSAYSSASRRS